MPEIVSQEKIKYGALSNLVRPNACPVQCLKEMLSYSLIFSLFLVNSRISVIQNSSVVIQRPSVGLDESVNQVFNKFQAFIVMSISPKDLN